MKKIYASLALATMLVAPLAHANPGFTLGANVAGTSASGYGKSSDFGFSAGYRFNPNVGLEVGYESLMGYEMTLLSASVLGRYRIADHLHLLGRLGVAHWTESPTGAHNATGTDPLIGVGLSYAITRAMSVRTEYQFVSNTSGKLGANLDTLMLGINYAF